MTTLVVPDYDEAIAFFTAGLGFDLVEDSDLGGGKRWVVVGGMDGGKLLLAVGTLSQTLRARGDVSAGPSPERTDDMAHLLQLVADGHLRVVVDRVADLDDVGAKAAAFQALTRQWLAAARHGDERA